jgi:hypothetical protein
MKAGADSRHALSRAHFFLEKAKTCPLAARDEYEAFLEASIVFARAAVHRVQRKYRGHPHWSAVWDSWSGEPAIEFFRKERDVILKEGPPKVGQKIFGAHIGSNAPAFVPGGAGALYYFEDADTPATATVERHLLRLGALLAEAEKKLEH